MTFLGEHVVGGLFASYGRLCCFFGLLYFCFLLFVCGALAIPLRLYFAVGTLYLDVACWIGPGFAYWFVVHFMVAWVVGVFLWLLHCFCFRSVFAGLLSWSLLYYWAGCVLCSLCLFRVPLAGILSSDVVFRLCPRYNCLYVNVRCLLCGGFGLFFLVWYLMVSC